MLYDTAILWTLRSTKQGKNIGLIRSILMILTYSTALQLTGDWEGRIAADSQIVKCEGGTCKRFDEAKNEIMLQRMPKAWKDGFFHDYKTTKLMSEQGWKTVYSKYEYIRETFTSSYPKANCKQAEK